MFVKSDIRKITIAVEKNLHSEVVAALGKASIVHLARVDEKSSRPEARLEKEESCDPGDSGGCRVYPERS